MTLSHRLIKIMHELQDVADELRTTNLPQAEGEFVENTLQSSGQLLQRAATYLRLKGE